MRTTSHASAEVLEMPEAPAIWLRRLWERMISLYGHTWTSVHGLTPHDLKTGVLTLDGDTWAKALAGLNAKQLAAGVAACLAQGGEFPPSAPRFRSMCLDIPILAVVRSELRRGHHSPFTRALSAKLDVYSYRVASADQADRMLRDAYEIVRDQVMRGQRLPAVPEAEVGHEKREFQPATREQVEAHWDEIQELLRGASS